MSSLLQQVNYLSFNETKKEKKFFLLCAMCPSNALPTFLVCFVISREKEMTRYTNTFCLFYPWGNDAT
jgi:hypothetical protein